MKKLLPLGSVLLLKDSSKRLMVVGRYQRDASEEPRIWDYSACLYPEGILNPEQLFLFNNDAITQVFFLGFQDGEEFAYIQRLEEEASEFMQNPQ